MASGSISFGGLASGLDTKSIVESLVTLKTTQLIQPLKNKLSVLSAKKLSLPTIEGVFKNLRTAALNLRDGNAFNPKAATSSITTVAKINSVNSSTAVSGTYDLTAVGQLAQPDRVIFTGVADKDSTQFGTGTITLTYKSVTTNITIDSTNNTLQGIATAINSASAGVTATIINDGSDSTPYRLTLTANVSGSDTTIGTTITGPTITVDAVSSATTANEPQNATFKINGVSMSSKSNTVSEAIAGLAFDLLSTDTTNTITLKIKQDTAGIVAKITSFVTAYANLRSALKVTVEADPITGKFSPLGRDVTFSSAKINIQKIMGRTFNSLAGYSLNSLAQIGITSDSTGALQVDTSKLTQVVDSSLTNVSLLFQGNSSENGIAEDMYTYVDNMTNAGGTFDDKMTDIDTQTQRLQKLSLERQNTVDAYQKKLQDQFNRLEKTINLLKSQESQLSSFTSLYSNSSNKLL